MPFQDNDQGETTIFATVVDAPTVEPRKVEIFTMIDRKAGEHFQAGAERIVLYLLPGDAYSMDGKEIQ